MKRKFTFLITAAVMLLTMMASTLAWGQSDYSTDYNGNITLSTDGGSNASACVVVIGSNNYNGIKAGTSKNAGAVKITVPSGTKYLHLHAAAWNNNPTALAVTPSGYSENIDLTANSGIANNSPFTFNGDPSTGDYYKVITFTNALAADTDLTFTATTGKRFVIWGVTAEEESSTPTITASNVNVAYDATEGSIGYEITNGTGNVSASVTTGGDWLSLGTITASAVPFTCSANDASAPRTATVTLSYTGANDKVVTVTQAGNPNIVNNISDITAAGTYSVKGTVVAKSTRGFVLGDGTGYVYYYKGSAVDQNVGDIVKISGAVSASNYKVFQYTNSAKITTATESNYVAEDPTVLSGSDMDAVVTGSNVLLSNYVQYQGTLTVSNGYYNITSIDGATTAKGSISYPTNTDFTSLDGKVVTVTGYYVGVSSSQYYNTMIGTVEEVIGGDPYITADDVEITYDTDADEIEYTINNPVAGGVLTASTTSDWLTLDDDFTSPIAFTCTANQAASSRTATVTLTYTYSAKATVTKDVTVTQSGNPNVFNNIEDITEVGTTYSVKGTVVAVNSKGFIMGDGTGYVYTYLNAAPTVAVGDMITVSGTTGSYGHIIQFTSSATIAEATSSNYDGTPEVTVINEVPDYSGGYHLATYLQFEGGLTKSGSNYLVAVGTSQIRIAYPTTDQGNELEALKDKTVRVHGFFSGISGSGTNAVFTATMESVEEVTSTVPSVTVTPATIDAPAEGADGTVAITYENIPGLTDFDYHFCDAEGNELFDTDPNYPGDWIYAEINENNGAYSLDYIIDANDGDARTAYLFVFYESYSAIVTVNQAAYVAPSYAELPFLFNGGRADIEGTDGLTQEGLGTDYNATSNPTTKLKFDGTGDWLLLQFNERPGTLTFDIKNNSFSGGTFKLQTSVDGATFDDLKTYSDVVLIGTLNEEFTNLGENVRYIKWIYTEKSNGNVGLGNIALAKYSTPTASITVTPETVNVTAEGEDEGSLAIAYENLTITQNDDFDIQFYNANGDPLDKADEPDWMIASVQATTTQDVYEVSYAVDPNDGAARTAYFKVYALDDDTNEVYSNLVTVTQDEYVAPIATITVTPETVNVETSGEDDGSLAIAYENLTITDPADFDIQYYNANNEPLDKPNEPTWLAVSVQAAATEGYVVSYSVDPNNGEARTAYFKVYALDNNSELVYSNLITINQAAYVVDYAELPFEWEGGPRSDFEALNGTSTYSVGDYGDNQGVYRMKLDGTGDYIQIKTNEQPGVVTIGVKMIGGATSSTLTVQGSEDGSTFTNVEALTISGKQNDILTLTTTNNFEASDRYVRLLFTKGSNVGVGPISIAKVDLTPSIAITSPEEFDSNAHNDEELAVTYKNVDLTKTVSIAFFESDGETAATYEWITAYINDDHNVAYSIEANTGAARTAYFKVIGKTSDDANVASNLVTISQAAPIPTFSITIATSIEHGTVEADKYTAEEGETVTLTATPDAGYVLNAWDVKDANDDPVEVTNNTFVMPASNVTVSATFIEAITYSLVTDASQIVSGKHYIIASSATDGTAYAMGDQSSSNRKGYAVTVANGIIAQTANVCEFVINTHVNSNNDTVYTIYDVLNPGYLYASSSSANQLKTTTTLNDNGRWTIEVANTGAATITAQGSNSRKLMRFNPNNNSPIFACYATNSTTGNAPCLYVKVNDNDYEYYGSEITYTENTIPADETVTVGVGSVMTVPSTFTNTNPANLIIEDGGQLIHDGDVSATIQLNVTGYGRDNSGYKLIASPVQTNLNVETETNLLNGTYDLYVFDEGQASKEWRNYRASAFTTIDNEKGYLYANASNITVTFSGELRPSNEDVTINLEYTTGNRFAGWNLVGNPFACNAYIKDATDNITAYYRMNAAGNNYVAATGAIAPMEGIFVQASAASQHFKFTREVPTTNSGHGNLNIQVAQTVADRDSQPAIDNAIIRFDGGNTLEKFCFRDDNSKLYIPQGNKDYAVVNSQAQGEMPVNFKAVEDGTYTIDFSMENVEFGYLHLIDNMTGMDVDLLQTPSYTFEGKQTDYASRFRLVFSANSNNESFGEGNGDFGFISNGNLMILGIEGEATLQVIDVTGRVLSSETFSGSYNKAVNASAGVYMIRLINGNDVKTQKIVVR